MITADQNAHLVRFGTINMRSRKPNHERTKKKRTQSSSCILFFKYSYLTRFVFFSLFLLRVRSFFHALYRFYLFTYVFRLSKSILPILIVCIFFFFFFVASCNAYLWLAGCLFVRFLLYVLPLSLIASISCTHALFLIPFIIVITTIFLFYQSSNFGLNAQSLSRSLYTHSTICSFCALF